MYQVQICTLSTPLFSKSLIIKLNYVVIFGVYHHNAIVLCHFFHRELDAAKIQPQAGAFGMRGQDVGSKDLETGKSLLDYVAELIEYLQWQRPHQSHMEGVIHKRITLPARGALLDGIGDFHRWLDKTEIKMGGSTTISHS